MNSYRILYPSSGDNNQAIKKISVNSFELFSLIGNKTDSYLLAPTSDLQVGYCILHQHDMEWFPKRLGLFLLLRLLL